jgi:O-acetyl-ADP-ribose deacetylase (regulator of RNase III)
VIEVRQENLVTADVECILRSVGSGLEPLTVIGREVGAAAGEAVITPAGDLSAAFIVHVALQSHEEPVSRGGLRKALQNGLRHARGGWSG